MVFSLDGNCSLPKAFNKTHVQRIVTVLHEKVFEGIGR